METQQMPVLAYAPPKPLKTLPWFRPVAFIFALSGLAFNLWSIHDIIWSLEDTRGVYDRLMADHRSFGREVALDIIARLEFPWWHWLSHGALAIASIFGMLLALHLLIALCLWKRNIDKTARYLKDYARFKLAAAIVTTICYFWARSADSLFWTYATRHTSIGSSEMIIISTAMLAVGGVISWWWVARGYKPAMAEFQH